MANDAYIERCMQLGEELKKHVKFFIDPRESPPAEVVESLMNFRKDFADIHSHYDLYTDSVMLIIMFNNRHYGLMPFEEKPSEFYLCRCSWGVITYRIPRPKDPMLARKFNFFADVSNVQSRLLCMRTRATILLLSAEKRSLLTRLKEFVPNRNKAKLFATMLEEVISRRGPDTVASGFETDKLSVRITIRNEVALIAIWNATLEALSSDEIPVENFKEYCNLQSFLVESRVGQL